MADQAKPRMPTVSGFKLVKEIGGGGFSKVYQAVNPNTQQVAACKVIAITPQMSQWQMNAIDKELKVHSALKHKHILELIGAAKLSPEQATRGGYLPAYYMLMEIAAGGDLFDKIVPDVGINEEIAHWYFCQMLAGLTYIHQQGVCHRDLKPENLLLSAAGTLKVCDFGLCAVYKIKETGKVRQLSERCGSLPYIAPELQLPHPYAAEPVDVWGIGVILFTMLTGNTPWDEPTKNSAEYHSYMTGAAFDLQPWTRFSREVFSLITGMLSIEPTERMTLADISMDPWVSKTSQLASRGPIAIAESLTQGLRDSGALSIAEPMEDRMDVDEDDDMETVTGHSPARTQFTQSLMLFTQLSKGRPRYVSSLTRFFAQLRPHMLLDLITEALDELGVKHNPPKELSGEHGDPDSLPILRMRIGTKDRRKIHMKGYVELEDFDFGDGAAGSFVCLNRDAGNPLEWRTLWKTIVLHPLIHPHVYTKQVHRQRA